MPVSLSAVMLVEYSVPNGKPESQSARVLLAALAGVADGAVGSPRQIGAAFDEVGGVQQRRHARRISALVVGERDRRATSEGQRRWTAQPFGRGYRKPDQEDDAGQQVSSLHLQAFRAMRLRSTGKRRNATPVAA